MFNDAVSNSMTENITKCEYLKIRKKHVVNCRQTRQDTVKPRFTNASDHEQFGLRTNFPNTKHLG